MSGEFTDSPHTISELRAARSMNPRDWSARDVLVSMLRSIDSGEMEEPEHIIIVHGMVDGGVGRTGYLQGGQMNGFEQLGMLHVTIRDIAEGD